MVSQGRDIMGGVFKLIHLLTYSNYCSVVHLVRLRCQRLRQCYDQSASWVACQKSGGLRPD